jgi:hypothetical protein
MPLTIKNLLNGRDVLGGGPIKYHRLAFRNSSQRTGIIPFAIKNLLNGERCFGGGQPVGRAHKISPTRIQKLFAIEVGIIPF